MSAIRTNLGALQVRVHGEGPVAVLWHSMLVDDGMWDRVAPALAEERTLVRITGPGHGGSEDWSRPFTLDDCAQAALQVLLELEVAEPVDWVGAAWGGHVGIALAARVPHQVRSLFACNAPVEALSAEEARPVRALATVIALLGPIAFARGKVIEELLAPQTRAADPAAVAFVDAAIRRPRRGGLANAIRSISLRRPTITPLLGAIAAPTLLVTGDDDPLWTPALVEEAAALLPRGRAATIPGTRHLAPLEAPGATIDLVRELWSTSRAETPA